MDSTKNTLMNRFIDYQRKLELFIAIQPIFLIYTLQTCLNSELRIRHMVGTPILGLVLGLGLIYILRMGNFDIKTKSPERTVFLLIPYIFWLLAYISSNIDTEISINTNLFFLFFGMLWLLSALKMFVRGNQHDKEKVQIGFFICIALVVLFFLTIAQGLPFSPDSYSYYDISKNILSNFGKISTVRQYVNISDINLSFPWLYPALICIVDNLTGLGMYSGVFINYIAAIITLFVILKITYKLCASFIPGVLVSLVLFSNNQYLIELTAARSIPLAILCLMLMLNIFAKFRGFTRTDIFLAGLFAGAGMTIRFDFLVVAGLTGLLLLPLFKKQAFKMMVAYGLGILTFASPWIMYSIIHFSTVWAYDNSGTMLMTYVADPLRFFLPGEIIPTLYTDYNAWLGKVWDAFGRISAGIFSLLIKPINLVLLGFSVYILTTATLRWHEIKEKIINQPLLLLILSLSLIYSIKTAIIVAAAYGDLRYHTETIVVFFMILLSCAYLYSENKTDWIKILTLSAVVLFVQIAPVIENQLIPKLSDQPLIENVVFASQAEENWAQLLKDGIGASQNEEVRVYFLEGGNPYRCGALLGIRAYSPVGGQNTEKLLYLFEHFIKPDYIFITDPDVLNIWRNELSDYYTLDETEDVNTYKVISLPSRSGSA